MKIKKSETGDTWKITIIAPIDFLPVLEEVLYAHNIDNFPTVADFEIANDPDNRLLEGYFKEEPKPDILKSAIEDMAVIMAKAPPAFKIEKLQDQNWVALSQKLLKPVNAGRFFVCGGHDLSKLPENKILINIEAGQAFGTGNHETTKGCLLAINSLYDEKMPKIALDLGCGSGVLAIAIAKQWPIKVIASDIDPIATDTARENIIVNDVNIINADDAKPGIATITCNGFEDTNLASSGPYNLIVANILAEPLQFLAHDIVKNLSADGRLILSGLLDIQEGAVMDAYLKQGMELVKVYPINEWHTLILKKKDRYVEV